MRNTIYLVIGITILATLVVFSWERYNKLPAYESQASVSVSVDKRSIVYGGKPLFGVDNGAIRDWVLVKSGLCDPLIIQSDDTRLRYCTDVSTYIANTAFKDVVATQSGDVVLFNLTSDVLAPDSVIGIYRNTTGIPKIDILTTYYLGNIIHSFTPDERHFSYTSGCFEARCAIYVLDVETLTNTAKFIPEEADMREHYEFIRWIGNDSYEYKEGESLRIGYIY